MFLSKINHNLRRTLLVVVGATALYIGARSCFGSRQDSGLENALAVEQQASIRNYSSLIEEVLAELPQHLEYTNRLLEECLDIAERNNSYSDKVRLKLWNFAVRKMEERPELTNYLGPNAKHYMKRKAIHDSASKVIRNVYDGIKEGVNIIKGE